MPEASEKETKPSWMLDPPPEDWRDDSLGTRRPLGISCMAMLFMWNGILAALIITALLVLNIFNKAPESFTDNPLGTTVILILSAAILIPIARGLWRLKRYALLCITSAVLLGLLANAGGLAMLQTGGTLPDTISPKQLIAGLIFNVLILGYLFKRRASFAHPEPARPEHEDMATLP